MFDDPSFITGKAPPDGQSDKKSGTLLLDWKTGGWEDVNGSRLIY
jgi:hypothetical protein